MESKKTNKNQLTFFDLDNMIDMLDTEFDELPDGFLSLDDFDRWLSADISNMSFY